jgi:polar amino acid transport system substrate-binding protein
MAPLLAIKEAGRKPIRVHGYDLRAMVGSVCGPDRARRTHPRMPLYAAEPPLTGAGGRSRARFFSTGEAAAAARGSVPEGTLANSGRILGYCMSSLPQTNCLESAMKRAVLLFSLFLLACTGLFAQKRAIELVYYDYLPFYGQSLKDGGAITKITAMAFQKAGYQTKVTFKSDPWARILKMAEAGEYDALVGIWTTKDKESYLASTEAPLNNDVGLFKMSTDALKVTTLAELKAQNIPVGMVRGYSKPKTLADANISIDEATDDAMLVNKLLQNRSRVIISDKALAIYMARKANPEAAKQMEWLFSVESTPLRTGIVKAGRSDWQAVVNDYNQALAALIKDGTVNKILKEYNLK